MATRLIESYSLAISTSPPAARNTERRWRFRRRSISGRRDLHRVGAQSIGNIEEDHVEETDWSFRYVSRGDGGVWCPCLALSIVAPSNLA